MATIIGAGFASGREIVQFFSTYYNGGFYGILLTGLLFAVIGSIVLEKVQRERIRNYEELLFPTIGYTLGWIMQLVVTLFIFCLFCVMLAGMTRVIMVRLNIDFIWSAVITSLMCMVFIL